MAVVLFITTEKNDTEEYPILEKCTIGRSSKCDIVVDDPLVSGKHGQFEFNSKGQLFYTDFDSTNGSFIESNKITKIQFKLNEVLIIGNVSIVIDQKKLTPAEKEAIGLTRKKYNSEKFGNNLVEKNLKNEDLKTDINKKIKPIKKETEFENELKNKNANDKSLSLVKDSFKISFLKKKRK